jgi:hypothetical protein
VERGRVLFCALTGLGLVLRRFANDLVIPYRKKFKNTDIAITLAMINIVDHDQGGVMINNGVHLC